ncbi:golgin subfamily A member 6-like protein 1 [Alosa sapidissima]|uniref:golgin subfamily A member 6-like protein 1 n=1 Tax=Alosa sapidissima TaxID=34773 RepID=UPI001C08A21C|nr:golgin subfamily A member 6-like protein 1 [Alosa sapidissima]
MAERSVRIPRVPSEGQLDPNFQEGRLRRPTPDKRELDQWVKELERKVARDRMRDELRRMREAVDRRRQEMWARQWEWHICQVALKKKEEKERQGAQLTGLEERVMRKREQEREEERRIGDMEEKVREQETLLKEKVKENKRQIREMKEKVKESERKSLKTCEGGRKIDTRGGRESDRAGETV